MITVLATFKALPGKEAILAEGCTAIAKEVREKEKGCLMYVPLVSVENPAEIVFLEKYVDQEAMQAHLQSTYFIAATARFPELLEGKPVMKIFKELV